MWSPAVALLVVAALACERSDDPREPKPEPQPEPALRPELPASFASDQAPRPGGGSAVSMGAQRSLRVLQLNLCNSGRARCYRQGQAVDEAIGLMRAHKPDVVTLNEICLADVTDRLSPAFGALFDAGTTYYSFQPTLDHVGGARSTCASGSLYGIAVLGHSLRAARTDIHAFGSLYDAQDGLVEDRAWTCTLADGDHLACTTHLSSDSPAAARAQCEELLTRIVPELRGRMPGIAAVIAGDLNLRRERAQPCVPDGYMRVDDGSVQHVLASAPNQTLEHRIIPLQWTDHPALLTDLRTSPAAQ